LLYGKIDLFYIIKQFLWDRHKLYLCRRITGILNCIQWSVVTIQVFSYEIKTVLELKFDLKFSYNCNKKNSQKHFSTITYCLNKKNVSWLKSTLELKIECWETHIYMKTECLQTNWMQHHLGLERKRVTLIKRVL